MHIKLNVHSVKCAMLAKRADICKPDSKSISGEDQSRHISRRVSMALHRTVLADILGSTSKGEVHLLTLEALWIRELKPFLNTQDTMRSRDLKLTIKF